MLHVLHCYKFYMVSSVGVKSYTNHWLLIVINSLFHCEMESSRRIMVVENLYLLEQLHVLYSARII